MPQSTHVMMNCESAKMYAAFTLPSTGVFMISGKNPTSTGSAV